jgi:TolA-binding protein
VRQNSPTLLALCLISAMGALSACASKKSTDNEPTLKALAGRTVKIESDNGVTADKTRAIDAYRKFLEIAPKAPQRAEAMRRIGDLEMDRADLITENPQSTQDPNYAAAITAYQSYLRTYPKDPANDHVLYQLARAQEQGGDLESALKTLDRLVKDYPTTSHKEEAQFRRGEMLFASSDYSAAEKAYAVVLLSGPNSQYHDRALYMQGWAQFKQSKQEDATHSFFGVLDLKVAGHEGDGGLDTLRDLSRADRELAEDTFRVTSLSLANQQGAESIPSFINNEKRRKYEFLVFGQLGELYLKQERYKDAADSFAMYAKRQPLESHAPIMQARVVDIYETNGFASLALDAKKDYVKQYGIKSEFRRTNPQGWEKAQPLVKAHLTELARHYHASAQKSKNPAEYEEAIHWYREFLESFPKDPEAAQTNFLLAELLFETKRFAEASDEYEKTAYGYPSHPKSADAGYSALLCYAQLKGSVLPAEQPGLLQISTASALRFADTFASDPRAPAVLADTAEKLYALKDNLQAESVAQKVLALQPAAPDEQRRIAWTVMAYTTFERGAFNQAEQAFGEVLKLTPQTAKNRSELIERQAASIYKQGEQARDAGKLRDAVAHFDRIGTIAPQSTIRATAQFDAAAALIALKDWGAAARSLEDFRQRYPNNPLQADVSTKLAVVYLESGQWSNAAAEFERLAANSKDQKIARDALWQAAELYEKADSRPAAAKAYERYVAQYPQPITLSIEARYRLAKMAKENNNPARELAMMKEIFEADQNGGAGRTERTRYLGANAALALAEPVASAYRKIALTEPLKKQLKLKKAKMEETLNAYTIAANYGVADVTTAATYHIANVYRDFSKALLASERPKKLNKLEREQYDVLLEEQAFPFEEKAVELHQVNAQRTTIGIYDKWVKSSFDVLRELQPVRYGKVERAEGVIDAIR